MFSNLQPSRLTGRMLFEMNLAPIRRGINNFSPLVSCIDRHSVLSPANFLQKRKQNFMATSDRTSTVPVPVSLQLASDRQADRRALSSRRLERTGSREKQIESHLLSPYIC